MKSVLLALVVALPAVAAQTVYTAAELAKLPDRRSQLVWTRGMSSSLADPPCKTAADCGGKHMKQPECVEQTGGVWSKCVDCDATAFQSSVRPSFSFSPPVTRTASHTLFLLPCTVQVLDARAPGACGGGMPPRMHGNLAFGARAQDSVLGMSHHLLWRRTQHGQECM